MQAVMGNSAEEIRQDEKTSYLNGNAKFLTFVLDVEEYGIEILKVREIIGMMSVTPVPQAPPHLKGVINLRGKVIPVFDLRMLFSMIEREYDNETCIIIVNLQGSLAGIVVDTVSEVLDIKNSDIEFAEQIKGQINAQFMLGISKVRDKIRILVDIESVLGSEQLTF